MEWEGKSTTSALTRSAMTSFTAPVSPRALQAPARAAGTAYRTPATMARWERWYSVPEISVRNLNWSATTSAVASSSTACGLLLRSSRRCSQLRQATRLAVSRSGRTHPGPLDHVIGPEGARAGATPVDFPVGSTIQTLSALLSPAASIDSLRVASRASVQPNTSTSARITFASWTA